MKRFIEKKMKRFIEIIPFVLVNINILDTYDAIDEIIFLLKIHIFFIMAKFYYE